MISLYGEIAMGVDHPPICIVSHLLLLAAAKPFLGRRHCRETRDSRDIGYQWKNDGLLP